CTLVFSNGSKIVEGRDKYYSAVSLAGDHTDDVVYRVDAHFFQSDATHEVGNGLSAILLMSGGGSNFTDFYKHLGSPVSTLLQVVECLLHWCLFQRIRELYLS